VLGLRQRASKARLAQGWQHLGQPIRPLCTAAPRKGSHRPHVLPRGSHSARLPRAVQTGPRMRLLLSPDRLGIAWCLQIEVRIQLDNLPNSPRIIEAVRSFNADQPSVSITLYPTPPYTSPRDISFDRPTLATDGRWSDFSAISMDDISVYLEPKLQRVQHLMHFHRDIFRRHNVSRAPQTWAELLELAARLNGTDFDGDGTPDYALCYNMQQHCRAPYMLMEALLPMFYYVASTVKPLYLDPLTLEPRFMNAATRAALHMLTQLSAFNNPVSSAACFPYDTRFSAGAPAPRSAEGQGTALISHASCAARWFLCRCSQRRAAA
jgi:hypothetical protein